MHGFDNALYPLFTAELEIDDAAGYPCLNGAAPFFQHQQIAL